MNDIGGEFTEEYYGSHKEINVSIWTKVGVEKNAT